MNFEVFDCIVAAKGDDMKEIEYKEYVDYHSLEKELRHTKTSNWLHFFLTLATGGGWILIWIIAAMMTASKRKMLKRHIDKIVEDSYKEKI